MDKPPDGPGVDLYEDWFDTQLARRTTTNSDAAGAGAFAELNRRLKDQLAESGRVADAHNASLEGLTKGLLWLTVVLAGLTILLVLREFGGV